MEVTKLVEGVSEYLGTAKDIPDREVSDVESIRKAVGDPDDILGPIPTVEEISAETSKINSAAEDPEDPEIEIEKQ
jgi:hypothetical protein